LMLGSHNDPGGIPAWLRTKVAIKTTIMSPEEINGIEINQFDELVSRPTFANLLRLEKKPSLDLNPSAKQMTKMKMHAKARSDRVTETGNAVYLE
jgi:hypothetical protein